MNEFTDRASARQALLALAPDLEAALDALRGFALRAGESSVLDRAGVRLALGRFVRGEISGELLERWAEAVHSAEDIDLDATDQAFLSEALFQLSTPELFGPIEEIVSGLWERDRVRGDRRT